MTCTRGSPPRSSRGGPGVSGGAGGGPVTGVLPAAWDVADAGRETQPGHHLAVIAVGLAVTMLVRPQRNGRVVAGRVGPAGVAPVASPGLPSLRTGENR